MLYGFRVDLFRGGAVPYLSLCADMKWSQQFPMLKVTSNDEAVFWEEDLEFRRAFVQQHKEIVEAVRAYDPSIQGVKLVALPE